METLFISDIHLDEQKKDISSLFLNFLYERASRADALYILGDLFDVWIGDDGVTSFQKIIIQALREVTDSHVPIYVVGGNRDFLLGQQFFEASGCQLLPPVSLISLYGVPVLVTHGDLLCTQDRSYQWMCRCVRNPIARSLFLLMPREFRRNLAQYLRKQSRQLPGKSAVDFDTKTRNQMMLQYNTRYLIHGHTHRAAIHRFSLSGQPAVQAVLGNWEQYGSALSVKAIPLLSLSFELQTVL